MTKKIVFIDIDGTLVDHQEEIPASAQKAIEQAKANGHLLYLCTGRSKPEIYEHILAHGFDGVIGAGGGYIESEGEIIYQRQVALSDVAHLVDFFTKHKVNFYLESNGGLYGNLGLKPVLQRLMFTEEQLAEPMTDLSHPFLDKIIFSDDNLVRPDVNKACFIEHHDLSFKEIQAEFANEFDVIQCTVPAFGADSGELMVPGVNKGVAIEFLLDHLNMDAADTIGLGDGLNDLEMFEKCKIGIAMGNAQEGLKEVADFVTTDLAADGLANAFKYANLI